MPTFGPQVLAIDAPRVCSQIAGAVAEQVTHQLKRQGIVVGISGGIDSATVAALACRAIGPDKVLGLALPERDSSPDSLILARELALQLGCELVTEDLDPSLAGLACYHRRDEALSALFDDFSAECRVKITLPGDLLERERLNVFRATVEYPDGRQETKRIPPREYLQIVAASNMKQRSRMLMLYYHAERMNYAVAGTGNLNEHDQGFFVKWGDGGADFKPIAHLYKTQVYALARHLQLPSSILDRIPTTDTYTAEVSQEDFFFGLPFELMDLLHWAQAHEVPAAEAALALNLTEDQVERVWRDFDRKHATTEYLRAMPLHINEGS